MKILINCSNLKIGGGLQVANSLIFALKEFKENTYFVVISKELAENIDVEEFEPNFQFVIYNIKIGINTLSGRCSFLDNIVHNKSIEKVFTLFGPSYWKPKVAHLCGYAKPHYIYEDSPFFKTLSLKQKILLQFKKKIHLRDFNTNNTALVSENPDVSEKLKTLFPKKTVFTVSNTYNQVFDNPEFWDKSIKLPVFNGHYILTVSANYPHKNLKIIFDTIHKLISSGHKNFKFILTLNEDDFQLSNTIKEHIIFLGKISIYQCPYLYQQVHFVLLPTLLECFSATYLEAMKMKKLILTSDLGFARGICCDSAIFFNPLDADDIKSKILISANSPSFCEDLIDKGYARLKLFENSQTRARKYLDILNKI